ncbi:hypothetical protein CBF34_00035 [Vagococcus penaei]|uniref:Uncharacterized protein n=1 Tax=Vagococcus penaei TaxID=633807 RepID=A0A1Q2D512_9ENTE|nr:hypothetical protein [Vagococcus penaei]AQP53490.1 hypothetical protein BW732_04110 [Vagococcus penaei]RSU07435.1 hypothetical protein CBF34_00035 [Vagococcus penaei]
MSKTLISIGSIIDYPTVHKEKITGKVELILSNTILIRDKYDDTHLVLKKAVEKDGFDIDEKTYVYATRYSRNN